MMKRRRGRGEGGGGRNERVLRKDDYVLSDRRRRGRGEGGEGAGSSGGREEKRTNAAKVTTDVLSDPFDFIHLWRIVFDIP